jgi:dTDP-4-amino-4,6-dideoxygalactose transaminase
MIPLVDLTRGETTTGQEIDAAIRRVSERGSYILGEEVTGFETEFSRYLGVDHVVGVNSGSDALFLALKCMGVGHGDEVCTVSHTFISTVDAIERNGAVPVFVDIDPVTCCMDPAMFKRAITPRTRAVIPVHLYGHPADLDPIREVAAGHHIAVIEDACQAHGARYRGRKVGGLSDMGCFSFYPTKNLGSFGDAGCVVTNNREYADRIRMIRNYGRESKHAYRCIGINSRLDEVQAAVLRAKLPYLDFWNDCRRSVARAYREGLEGTDLDLPTEQPYAYHVYHLYVVRSVHRDRISADLAQKGVQTGVHYPVPVHRQSAYRKYADIVTLPVTERIAGEVLSLPMHPWLEDREIDAVVRRLRTCV